MLDKHCSGVIVVLAVSSMLMDQQYILNKVSVQKHTKDKFMYWLVDKLGWEEHNPLFFSHSSDSLFANSVFVATL